MRIISTPNGSVIRGFVAAETPRVAVDVITTVTDAGVTSAETTDKDHVNLTSEDADWQESALIYVGAFDDITYTSLDPDSLAVDAAGKVTISSAPSATFGQGVIEVDMGRYGRVRKYVRLMRREASPVHTFLNFVDGTLADSVTTSMAAAAAGKTAADAPMFSIKDGINGGYTRNVNCWASGFAQALTCVSAWNSNGGYNKAGTLITPRHLVVAAHYVLNVGDVVHFVAVDNTLHSHTITQVKTHPYYFGLYPDYRVCLLDVDVDAAITPASILPADIDSYTLAEHIPCITVDSQKHVTVRDITEIFSGVSWELISYKPSHDSHLGTFYEAVIGGDSGSPTIMMVGGEACLLTVMTYGGSGSGTNLMQHVPTLNQLIADVDIAAGINTGYTCTIKDLSSFPTY